MSKGGEVVKGNWTNESAFNLQLALDEARTWIEAVVGVKFPYSDFQQSLKNGVFLCKYVQPQHTYRCYCCC